MDYIEVNLQLSDPTFGEILEAELAECGFESFQIQGATLQAYIPASAFDRQACEHILDSYRDAILSSAVKNIEHTNWNALWESNYPPVLIGNDLFIGAPFHEVPANVKHTIVLEPNMSFGTGHHPTTAMMLRCMSTLDLRGKTFLDFGCGSAILSIYASQLGAHGLGVEIDPHAASAARANLELNSVKGFTVESGGVEKIKGHTFDVIAANINKNVIEECAAVFEDATLPGGLLLCSGFLSSDVPALTATLASHHFQVTDKYQVEDWAMLATKKAL